MYPQNKNYDNKKRQKVISPLHSQQLSLSTSNDNVIIQFLQHTVTCFLTKCNEVLIKMLMIS
jgi:hypothetical protein